MTGKDFSIESEDEFYEDFSGWEITDASDVRLRRLVKQTQYLRWLLPQLLEIAELNSIDNNIINLARAATRTMGENRQSKES